VFKNGIIDNEEIFYLAQIKRWFWAKFTNFRKLFFQCLIGFWIWNLV